MDSQDEAFMNEVLKKQVSTWFEKSVVLRK